MFIEIQGHIDTTGKDAVNPQRGLKLAEAVAPRQTRPEPRAANSEISKHVDRRALQRRLDTANHLGCSGHLVDRMQAPLV